MPGKSYFAEAWFGQDYIPLYPWGVDSTTHADQNIPDPDLPTTTVKFFDLVTRKIGRPPEFWGRYIGSPTDSFNLYPSEAQYLASKNCRILLNYDATTSSTIQTTQQGVTAAMNAINFINNNGLLVPRSKRVAIYCNIEPNWSPLKDFFGGWFDTLDANGYVGGVYGNTADQNFDTPYCQAYAAVPSGRVVLLWTFQPQIPCDLLRIPPFTPTPPSCPAPAPPTPPRAVAYQYSINCVLAVGPPQPPPVDLDLANDQGFRSMWALGGWQAYVIDLHNDANNSGIVCAPSLERLPDTRLVAVMAVAHAANSPADLGAYVSLNDGQTWATPVELTNLPVGLPQTMVEWNGNILVFAGANPIYQAVFDTTALAWVNFGTVQSPTYWRSWYAPGGTRIFRFLRAARTFDRTHAAVTALSDSIGSPFIPIASDGTAGPAQTIPIFGTAGPLMVRWVGASPQVARMRPFDQLQYVSGQLYFDPSVPQYIDLYTQSGTTWTLNSTYTVDSLSKLTAPTSPDVMQVLRRGLWNVDYAWGPGTVAANGSDMYGFFSDNPIRPDAGGLSGLLSGRFRRQVGGIWTEDPVNFATDANPALNEQNYNLHSQAMWLDDDEFRAVIEMAGPTYPGNGHYWFVRRRLD